MQYYRCRCGMIEAWASYPIPDCEGCPECKTTLALGPDDHETPTEHDWIVQYRQNGEEFEICSRCHTPKKKEPNG